MAPQWRRTCLEVPLGSPKRQIHLQQPRGCTFAVAVKSTKIVGAGFCQPVRLNFILRPNWILSFRCRELLSLVSVLGEQRVETPKVAVRIAIERRP